MQLFLTILTRVTQPFLRVATGWQSLLVTFSGSLTPLYHHLFYRMGNEDKILKPAGIFCLELRCNGLNLCNIVISYSVIWKTLVCFTSEKTPQGPCFIFKPLESTASEIKCFLSILFATVRDGSQCQGPCLIRIWFKRWKVWPHIVIVNQYSSMKKVWILGRKKKNRDGQHTFSLLLLLLLLLLISLLRDRKSVV